MLRLVSPIICILFILLPLLIALGFLPRTSLLLSLAQPRERGLRKLVLKRDSRENHPGGTAPVPAACFRAGAASLGQLMGPWSNMPRK